MKERTKYIKDSRVEVAHIIRPTHLNASGRLFGGILLQWIDEVAGIVAKRHSNTDIITASIDNLVFLKGAYQKDTVVLIGTITHVGNSSMEIRVDTFREDITGLRTLINSAYILMVALGKDGESIRVPRIELTTEDEKKEWELGTKRQEMRLLRKQAGY